MDLIREMFAAYGKKETGYDMRVKSGYYMLLYLLVSVYRELDVKDELLKQNRKLNKLTPITNYMKEHYREELSLEALAEVLDMLLHIFQECFKNMQVSIIKIICREYV